MFVYFCSFNKEFCVVYYSLIMTSTIRHKKELWYRIRRDTEMSKGRAYPLAVGLHVAALEGTVERVSVEFLEQSAATAEEDVLSTPAFICELLQNLPTGNKHTF